MDYAVIDIETCPNDTTHALSLTEDERKKLINPIDSHIVALGIRTGGENIIIRSDDETRMLREYWMRITALKARGIRTIVGFNIVHFDIPFLITRSFILNVPIEPFTLKELIDIREKISAYRYGPVRGTLKEFAESIGIETIGDGSDVLAMCMNHEWDRLEAYLIKDLEITDSLYLRAKTLGIVSISRW